MTERAFVFAPSPLLTVTVEDRGGSDDIHLHAGGQGFWIARLVKELGVDVTLCGSFSGEVGQVVRALVCASGVAVRSVEGAGTNGAYVHDRRTGERQEVADMVATPLSRHEVDELYGACLVEALEADVCVLGGPGLQCDVVPASMYRRLAADLRANGRTVVADLSQEPLHEALAGGLSVLKVSEEELLRDGEAAGDDVASLVRAMESLHERGADRVVVTRSGDPALVLHEGGLTELVPPQVEPVDHRGGGDSLTAGIVAGLARGLDFLEAVRLGTAAGSLNVTRHGLATGSRDEIERLARHIDLRPVDRPVAAAVSDVELGA